MVMVVENFTSVIVYPTSNDESICTIRATIFNLNTSLCRTFFSKFVD